MRPCAETSAVPRRPRTASSTVTSTACGVASAPSARSSSQPARTRRRRGRRRGSRRPRARAAGDRQPDPTRCARDDRDLAVEHHRPSMLRARMRHLRSEPREAHTAAATARGRGDGGTGVRGSGSSGGSSAFRPRSARRSASSSPRACSPPSRAGFFASWVWLIALAIGLVTMIFASMSFSELATMIPKAGSMNEYVRAGLGPFFATVTVGVGYIAVQLVPGHRRGVRLRARHERRARAPGSTTSVWVRDLHRLPGGDQPARDPAVRGTRGDPDLRGRSVAADRRHRRPGRRRHERSDRQRAAGHRPHLEPALGAARSRDLHLRRRRVHVPARGGAEAPAA